MISLCKSRSSSVASSTFPDSRKSAPQGESVLLCRAALAMSSLIALTINYLPPDVKVPPGPSRNAGPKNIPASPRTHHHVDLSVVVAMLQSHVGRSRWSSALRGAPPHTGAAGGANKLPSRARCWPTGRAGPERFHHTRSPRRWWRIARRPTRTQRRCSPAQLLHHRAGARPPDRQARVTEASCLNLRAQ